MTVLTTGFWPTYKSTELALPREMADSVEVYREYYDTDSKHRWDHQGESRGRGAWEGTGSVVSLEPALV